MEVTRTTLELNKNLLDEAIGLLPDIKSKEEIIELALNELVAKRKQKNLIELRGRKDLILDSYDYKAK